MTNNRREFIKAGILGAAAVGTGLPAGAEAACAENKFRPLEVLILGGTGFIGPHMVREALRRGHKVTLFNRGKTNNALFPDLETIKGDRDNGLDGLRGRKFDAVIDNSGYVPRHVADSSRLLADHTDRYVYISTVSVYDDFSIANTESSALGTMADESVEEVTGETYGPLKALCEKRAQSEIESDQLTIIRPTYICGPGDHTDRFSYWGIRTKKGGDMLWPGSPTDGVQIVDVRDLATFTIDSVDQQISGIFNAVNEVGSYSMGDMLVDAQAVTATNVNALWMGEKFADDNDLMGGRTLPVWHPSGEKYDTGGSFSGKASRDAGFHYRPERETMRDLLVWWETLDEDRRANVRAGIKPEREAELIAKWKSTTGSS